MGEERNLIKIVMPLFRQRLKGIYPDREIIQFVYILFDEYLGWMKTRVHLNPDDEIPATAIKSINQALEVLCTGKPIQYILGKAWFNGIQLKVDGNVLIPRPETEELCSMIKADPRLQDHNPISILDIGTGSGCIAIDLKKHFPHAAATAVDNSTDALEIAAENAKLTHCDISFIRADILDRDVWTRFGKFNLIVSNPPYVTEGEKTSLHRNVTGFEPEMALFVADNDPLVFYKAITGFAASHLIPPARFYVEINERFGREVSELFHSGGFDDINVLHDFHGKERFVSATLKSSSTLSR